MLATSLPTGERINYKMLTHGNSRSVLKCRSETRFLKSVQNNQLKGVPLQYNSSRNSFFHAFCRLVFLCVFFTLHPIRTRTCNRERFVGHISFIKTTFEKEYALHLLPNLLFLIVCIILKDASSIFKGIFQIPQFQI